MKLKEIRSKLEDLVEAEIEMDEELVRLSFERDELQEKHKKLTGEEYDL